MEITDAATTCGGGQQGADKDHRVSQATAYRAKQLADGVQHVFGHAGAFQYQAHEGKERYRQQRIVTHDVVYLIWQRLQQLGAQQLKVDADPAEQQAHSTKGKGYRIADQQKSDQRTEHDGSKHFEAHTGSL